jgi:hypothetical protein
VQPLYHPHLFCLHFKARALIQVLDGIWLLVQGEHNIFEYFYTCFNFGINLDLWKNDKAFAEFLYGCYSVSTN